MIRMRFLQDVATIKKLAQDVSQFVRITSGPKTGSIARVVDIRHINYSDHTFYLHIDGHRKFWMKSRFLEYLNGYTGPTKYVLSSEPPVIVDLQGKEVVIGCVVVFHKILVPGTTTIPDMIVGTVKEIKRTGSIVVKPLVISNPAASMDLIEVRKKPLLILHGGLLDGLMLRKLTL